MDVRRLRIVILVIVAFVAGLLLARALAPSHRAPPQTERATLLPEPRALAPLDLVDQDGRPLGPDALQGRWTLVFFGFTQCPDICPTTLATLAGMRRQLADLPPAEQPGVLLVTVDPERDTPERLAAYVRFFDPAFRGATGTAEAVAAAARAFGVPYARVETGDGQYTMDHGSGVFVVDPQARLAAYSSAPHDAAMLARDYRLLVGWARGTR